MREKLIELLKLSPACLCNLCGEDGAEDRVAEVIAENLIANGVTIQKWIPVSDRLPDLELVKAQANDEQPYPCLVTIKHRPSRGGKCVIKLWYDGEGFVDRDYMEWTALVTHWVPLPEPPEGE